MFHSLMKVIVRNNKISIVSKMAKDEYLKRKRKKNQNYPLSVHHFFPSDQIIKV